MTIYYSLNALFNGSYNLTTSSMESILVNETVVVVCAKGGRVYVFNLIAFLIYKIYPVPNII